MRGLLLRAEAPRKDIFIPALFLRTSSVTMKQHLKVILNLERLWGSQAALGRPSNRVTMGSAPFFSHRLPAWQKPLTSASRSNYSFQGHQWELVKQETSLQHVTCATSRPSGAEAVMLWKPHSWGSTTTSMEAKLPEPIWKSIALLSRTAVRQQSLQANKTFCICKASRVNCFIHLG